jgi:hypothetical protein
MRLPVYLLALAATLASAPAGAQPTIQPDEAAAPNARAAQRPLGPNALAAQRPAGPNRALIERAGRPVTLAAPPAPAETAYPSCAAAGATRALPLRRGEAGYARHLDPDGDGIACD